MKRNVALVTGGSRGIGAAAVIALADHGNDVILTYRNKVTRAQSVAAEVERRGGRCLVVAGDLTHREDVERMARAVEAWSGRLNTLVLNASGGLERDLVAADPTYPRRINCDAQLLVLDTLLPFLVPGSVVVFVTSHWAHLYGQVEQLPAYAPVAESKWEGEQAIRSRQAELLSHGIRLIVVSGDLVEGTITPKLLERAGPGMTEERRAITGRLPSTGEMGEAIAAAASNTTLPSGHTVVVGGVLDTLKWHGAKKGTAGEPESG